MNRIKLIFVMFLWGSIGLLTKYIDLTPIALAFYRALISVPVLLVFYFSSRSKERIRLKDLLPYVFSGLLMGLAWLCLFSAFEKMDISLAILVYNMCPIYVLILSPFVFKEKMGMIQGITIIASFIGLYMLIGGNINQGSFASDGLFFALVSGFLYAVIVLINRKVKNSYNPLSTTLIQMLSAILVLIPVGLIKGGLEGALHLNFRGLLLLFILGIVHTGIAYTLYFSTYNYLKAVEIVSFSYLEPLFAILLGLVFLNESLNFRQVIGGIIILGFTFVNDFRKSRMKSIVEV